MIPSHSMQSHRRNTAMIERMSEAIASLVTKLDIANLVTKLGIASLVTNQEASSAW
jgi:hypothetical protein